MLAHTNPDTISVTVFIVCFMYRILIIEFDSDTMCSKLLNGIQLVHVCSFFSMSNTYEIRKLRLWLGMTPSENAQGKARQ